MQMGTIEMTRIHFRLNLIMCSRFWHVEILMSMLFSIKYIHVVFGHFEQLSPNY